MSPLGDSLGERTKPGERRLSSLEPAQRRVSAVTRQTETPERRKSAQSPSPPVPEQRQSLITEPQELGARPRMSASATPVSPAARKMSDQSESGSVLLKQSSWGSSRWVAGAGAKKTQETPGTPVSSSAETPGVGDKSVTSSSGNSFLRRKDLWERRSMSSPGEGDKQSLGWGSKERHHAG